MTGGSAIRMRALGAGVLALSLAACASEETRIEDLSAQSIYERAEFELSTDQPDDAA